MSKYGSFDNKYDLRDKIDEEGFDEIFYYGSESFINSPIWEKVKDFITARENLEKALKEKLNIDLDE